MKTLAQSLLTALLLSTATFANDITTPAEPMNPTVTTNSYKVAVFPSSTMRSKLNVIVEREPGQPIIIRLKDADGTLLATQLVDKKQGSFRFQFDLTNLQDGNYRVEIVSGNDVTVRPVTLATQPVQETTRQITLN